MLKTEVALGFCEKMSFFTSKPNRNCLLEAVKLNLQFGLFIKSAMVSGRKFASSEDFLSSYQKFCGPTHS